MYQNEHTTLNFRRSHTVLFVGEAPSGVLTLTEGYILIHFLNHAGERRTVGILGPGDILPAEWVSGLSQVSLYHYTALTDCSVIRGARNPALVEASVFRALSAQLTSATMHLAAIQENAALDTLIGIFRYLFTRFGKKLPGDWYEIPLRLTHQDLAAISGHTRETITVNLRRIRKLGIIQSQRSFYYKVNVSRLHDVGELQ